MLVQKTHTLTRIDRDDSDPRRGEKEPDACLREMPKNPSVAV